MTQTIPQFYQQAISLMQNNQTHSCQLGLATSNLEALCFQAPHFLHMNELTAYQKLLYERRQFSFLLGKYCAKNTFAHYRNTNMLTSFQIKNGSFNQPILSGHGTEEAAISLSHSEKVSICLAFPSTFIMGIDIEHIQVTYENVLQEQMTEKEISLLTQLNNCELNEGLFRLWTMKEALGKALKTGLTIDLRLLSVATIENKGDYWISRFQNFSQYHAYTFQACNYICSVVLPKDCAISLDLLEIRSWLATNDSLIAA